MDCRHFILRFGWLSTVGVLGASGCALMPHRDPPPAKESAATSSAAANSAATNPSNPAEMAAIMNEVQQLGVLDPQAQNALLEDLKKTDPSLWPQLVQTFRASIAYRRQAEDRVRREAEQMLAARGAAGQAGAVRPAAYIDGHGPIADGVQPLPGAEDGALSPKSPPAEFAANYPNTNLKPIKLGANGAAANAADDGDWRTQLSSAIRTLESQHAADNGQKSPAMTDQANLRLLHLAAGHRDDALRPISGVSGAEQEFWSEEIFGLATAMDDQKTPDPQRRAAEAAQHLRDAAFKLSQSAQLTVRNLAFCSEVNSFGVYKPFSKYEFKPGQEVLLYSELENFTSEATEKGYHTALHSSYQILDSRGAKVAEQDYAVTEEVCRNQRRDFFVRYFLNMPKRIYDGNYTLQLTIEDSLGKKVGQSSIQFAIVGAD